MASLSIGKIRGLQEISSPEGLITVLALDHRGTLIKAMGLNEKEPNVYTQVRDFKFMVIKYLLPHATAVLIDPQFGGAEAIARGVIPGTKGLMVTLESSGFKGESTARLNEIIPGWSPAKIKRMGASAIKFKIDYHPDAGKVTSQMDELVASVSAEAAELDIPLLLEPVSYSIDPKMKKESAEYARQRPAIVLETARRLGPMVDVLKLEFPHDASFNNDEKAWEKACKDITLTSPVPWVLLSAGVEYDIFKRQAKAACQAGASGYVAGRAIFQEAAGMQGSAREDFLKNVSANRMKDLKEMATITARPWTKGYPGLVETADENWIKHYSEK
jgi:tagatose 1,6-diphosphate aldolase